MAFSKFRLRRDTLSNWTAINPILAEGEWGVVTPDTGTGKGKVKIKIGDGVTAFINLPYAYNEAEIDISILESTFEDWTTTTPVPSPEVALANIISGANNGSLWSNIKAFCKGVITLGKISNNLITTEAGLALDARQGKVLNDAIGVINNNLDRVVKTITTILATNCTLVSDATRNKIIYNNTSATISIRVTATATGSQSLLTDVPSSPFAIDTAIYKQGTSEIIGRLVVYGTTATVSFFATGEGYATINYMRS